MLILKCSYGKGIAEVAKGTERLPCACILLSPAALAGRSRMELSFAFHLARRAFEGKRNISGKLSNEALLFLSREMNFASALKKIGAKDAREFVLVCEKNIPLAKLKKELALVAAKSVALSEKGKKKGHYFEGELAVEEMALARVKN